MNRSLHWVNAVGVTALAVLCIFQWSENRRIHLQKIQAEQNIRAQTARILELEKNAREQKTDLDGFRAQLTAIHKEAKATSNDSKHPAAETDLRENLTRWTAAVSARDAQLKEAALRLGEFEKERDRLASDLAKVSARHNQVMQDLNQRTRENNELIERLKSAEAGLVRPKP